MKRLFQQTRRVVLFDSSNVIFRACAVGKESYLDQFCRMVSNYRKRFAFYEFVWALEGKGTDERRKIFPEYKNGRIPAEELIEARKRCVRLLRCSDCEVIRAPLGEADDAIGAFLAADEPPVATVVSEDRDLWQLIRPGKYLIHSQRRGTVTPETVKALLGVPPSKIPLYKAVFGDSSDGLPRVPRVPAKLLLELVQQSASIKELEQHIASLEGKDAKRLATCKKQIRVNYQLAKLRIDLPLKRWKYEADDRKFARRLQQYGVSVSESDRIAFLEGVRQ